MSSLLTFDSRVVFSVVAFLKQNIEKQLKRKRNEIFESKKVLGIQKTALNDSDLAHGLYRVTRPEKQNPAA